MVLVQFYQKTARFGYNKSLLCRKLSQSKQRLPTLLLRCCVFVNTEKHEKTPVFWDLPQSAFRVGIVVWGTTHGNDKNGGIQKFTQSIMIKIYLSCHCKSCRYTLPTVNHILPTSPPMSWHSEKVQPHKPAWGPTLMGLDIRPRFVWTLAYDADLNLHICHLNSAYNCSNFTAFWIFRALFKWFLR